MHFTHAHTHLEATMELTRIVIIFIPVIFCTSNVKGYKGSCDENSILCHDGSHCVETTKFCDGVHDCSDFSDEYFCGKQNCTIEEFPCYDGQQCVLRLHVCDHAHDCHDGSDEDVCEPSERCSLQHHRYLCGNEQQCIHVNRLCNGVFDCADRSDEGSNCAEAKNNCSNGVCNHVCIPTPSGSICQCKEGFLLKNNSCEDINECMDNVCSQFCINLQGSYTCFCQNGYILQKNGSCIAEGPDPILYIAAYNKVISYNLRSDKKDILPFNIDSTHIQDIATDGSQLYWTDNIDKAVYVYDLESHHNKPHRVIDTGLSLPVGIAVDRITALLFIVDSFKNRIIACNNYGDLCTVIHGGLDKPQDIFVVHNYRKLIWSEIGKNPCLSSSEMNGQKKNTIVRSDIQHPHSLAVDEVVDRLYWVDSVLDRIESVHFDGTDRKIVLTRMLSNPFGIAVFEDTVYWGDQEYSSIFMADKVSGRRLLPLATQLSHVTSLLVNHPVLYNKGNQSNPCWNHDCSKICLPFGRSYTCGCSFHKKIDKDNKTCIDDDRENCPYMLVGENRAILKYPLCGIGQQLHLVSYIMVGDMKQVSVIGQDKSRLLYRDVLRGVIAMVDLENTGTNYREIILYTDHSAWDACVDWNSGIIYWTDPIQGLIKAGSLNGRYIATVVKLELQRPTSITVDSENGYIYFSDTGRNPKIWLCYTDGSHCNTISVKVSLVNDIVYDHESKHLFYTETDHSVKAASIVDDFHVETIYSAADGGNPMYLAVYGDSVYWTDPVKKVIMSASKNSAKGVRSVILSQLAVPGGLILVPSFRKTSHNVCSDNNGGCRHLCFVTPTGRSCKCQDGWILDSDQQNCQEYKCDNNDCQNAVNTTLDRPTLSVGSNCNGFRCVDNLCIDKKFVCDNHPDCYDAEDEIDCKYGDGRRLFNQSNVSCDPDKYYTCDSGECLPLSEACDGTVSCSDENGLCDSACIDSNCSHGCYPTPKGPFCYCYHGYHSSGGNADCLDINECDTRNGGCSQLCVNKNGSHICTCAKGYTASVNGTVCTAQGSRPSFVIGSKSEGLFQLNDLHQKVDLDLSNTSKDVYTMDINMQTGDIYFCTQKLGIKVLSAKTKSTVTILKDVGHVTDLAYDWIGNNLYVADSQTKKLLVCNVKVIPLKCKTLHYDVVWTSLALYPEKGIMFMVSSGSHKQIQKLCMNGNHQEVVIGTNLTMPACITVDIPANRIYWIDEALGRVESANLDGNDRYTVFEESPMYHFTNLDVFENDLFLTDRRSASLVQLNKVGYNKPPITVYEGMPYLLDVRVIHPLLQQQDKLICQILKCTQLCLMTVDGAECSCYDGFLTHPNNTSRCLDMRISTGTPTLKEKEPQNNMAGSDITPSTTTTSIPSITTENKVDTKRVDHNTNIVQQPKCYLPCQHGGKCVTTGFEEKCLCTEGYTGKLCELEEKKHRSKLWVIGLGMLFIVVVLAITIIYFCRQRRNGNYYLLCRRKPDDAEEGLVSDNGPLFGNPVFHEFEDINYPPECSRTELHSSPSCQSVDSAFVSKREDSDSQSSCSSGTGSSGHYGYKQI